MQARFALRPTAPMFAHTRCSHIVWRAYGAAARVLTRAAAARSSLRGRRFLASARPMASPVSQLSAFPRHAWSHNRPPHSRCCGKRTVRARLSRGAVRLWHPLATTACPGVARPAPQQPSLPALLGIRSPRCRAPNGSCMPHGASYSSAAARTPLVGSNFPRRSAQKKRPAERWSLWQFVALAVRELCADYSARSFRRRSSSSAS